MQGREAEVRILVDKTSIFGTQREVPRQEIISATAVQEGTFRLSVRAGHESASIACGTKDQSASSSEGIGTKLADTKWKVYHQVARDPMYIRLDSGWSAREEIPLCVPIKTVVPFGGEPTVEVI